MTKNTIHQEWGKAKLGDIELSPKEKAKLLIELLSYSDILTKRVIK